MFESNILPHNKADFIETLAERVNHVGENLGLPAAEKPDHRHRLLRARCEWPSSRRAAKQRDELAAPHVEHGLPPAQE
jgi:hypothetical protein